MTIGQAIIRAIERQDATLAHQIAEHCATKFGLDYRGTYEFVNGICPVEPNDWEALLLEGS